MKHLLIPFALLLINAVLHAEMKCEAGKCSTGKETIKNVRTPKAESQALSDIRSSESTKNRDIQTKKRNHKITVKQLFNVRTVKVLREESMRTQTNYGYIVEDESRITEVTPLFTGYIRKLYIKQRYSKVRKGDALAAIYSPEVYKAKQEYLNALDFNTKRAAVSMVKSAKSKLILLGIAPQEIKMLERSRKLTPLTTLYAPSNGWITKKSVAEGSYVSAKKAIFTIVDTGRVWMEAKLYQDQLEKLEALKKFEVTLKGIKRRFQAHKELLYPVLDPKEATATLRLGIDNPEGILKIGMYATLHSSTETKTYLTLPRSAVIRKNGNWYAFLATEFNGEYEPVKIRIKPLNRNKYEIIEGLKEGDTVVDNALFMMDSDAQINGIY